MISMTRKLFISFLVMFVILACIIGYILIKDYGKDANKQTSVNTPTPTTTPTPSETPTPEPTIEATQEATVEPTQQATTQEDTRFTSTDSYLVIANKKHKLPDGYEPSDLVSLTVPVTYEMYMRSEAANALSQMFAAANATGLNPVATSAYRSEAYQRELYDSYVQRDGQEAADTYSSRPGYSDHQTGLTADITCASISYKLNTSFEDTAEGQWLAQHAHEYGFIMRYPNGKEAITGYTYEPWHFRYIGVEEATAIYNTDPNMTMEEYYGVEGGGYAS